MKIVIYFMILFISLFEGLITCNSNKEGNDSGHEFNSIYTGKNLDRIAFPVGGIGAGMFCMEGTGAISNLSVRNRPDIFNEPYAFAAISLKGYKNGAKILETQVPTWKLFGPQGTATGGVGKNYGLPRFESGSFLSRFPFSTLILKDKEIPLKVHVTAWSPFIPTDADNSSLPVGVLEYYFKNTTNKKIEAVFSYHAKNFIDSNGPILKVHNGFKLARIREENNSNVEDGFVIYVNNDNAVLDYSWFRGGWRDPETILWKNIKEMNLVNNQSIVANSPGASIYVPFSLNPGEEIIIPVNFCWYFPETKISHNFYMYYPLTVNYYKSEIHEDKTEKDTSFDNNQYYKPWYAERFKNIDEIIDYWSLYSSELKDKSELFSNAFFSSTLPDEVIEAVAANLTILKSPTVLRQADGRLWCYEGCRDDRGCCYGSCTHVWNYAQAIPHLFPELERSFRETEFKINQNEEGHQAYRTNLPISEPGHNFHSAADGQLGGIMKIYRDWRISGNTDWISELYPIIKRSMDYCIETWDPKNQGYLEEPQHNTYDVEFWGPNGMCTSIYLGALTAFIEISEALNVQCDYYNTLLGKGKKYIENNLFNGEYFFQKIKWTGLNAPDPWELQSINTHYSQEALKILNKEGPKYQYGTGCLSDGIIGMWMAKVCGLQEIVDEKKVKNHLLAVYKYNFKKDLTDHVNPQRSTYACGKEGGLILCSWPQGDELSFPFNYSCEVWTGTEYQVASHLIFKGEVEKGLEIIRECRKRYNGIVRNPFNEYEAGHWYARALASYSLLQAITGVRYDAVDKTLYIDSRIGDFRSFISTETGFGNVGLKNGEPYVDIAYGDIDIKKVWISGTEEQ